MTEQKFALLKEFFQRLAPLPLGQWDAFAEGLTLVRLAPGESLVRFGGSPERTGFVVSGLIKAYYMTRKGDEFIRTFCAEGSLAASLAALVSGSDKAEVDLVAIEPTELVAFDYDNFRRRLPDHWTWQQIGRVVMEATYFLRERRQFELMTMSANERFELFMRTYPDLASRISQRDLASYLGMTPVSLSRLRAKRRAK